MPREWMSSPESNDRVEAASGGRSSRQFGGVEIDAISSFAWEDPRADRNLPYITPEILHPQPLLNDAS